MRLNRSNLRPSTLGSRLSTSEAGVALIITVIMISVITFLTVAFLALSGREKNSVKVATNQTTARLAADEASLRAQTEMLGAIMTSGNVANYDLLVSTNFVNWNGFDTAAFDQTTNVNYEYLDTGGALNPAQGRQNLANLLFSPRPPVFIGPANEFRYYLDLNRNGRHDRSGYWPVISPDPANPFYDLGGATMPSILFGNTLSNNVIGDPEWIGGLNRPQQPHSSSNKFLYRYAYVVVPEGKTLDINYIHNQALTPAGGNMNGNGQGFFRNQGVGSWEINFAAFLRDLNTNQWDTYDYDPVNAILPGGITFADAAGLYSYRLNGNPTSLNYPLASVNFLYGVNGDDAFTSDFVDGYTDGPLLTAPYGSLGAPEDAPFNSWPGAYQANHFFTTQDLFDPNKVNRGGGGFKFTDRLFAAANVANVSTYDQTTFYRMIAQLGTDSATEGDDKLNLNYVNVGGLSVSNYVPWSATNYIQGYFGAPASIVFFTNAVDRLLRAYTEEWLAADRAVYTNIFKTDKAFAVTNIPVFVSNQFIYPPAVHRVLQMAANIWESKNPTNMFPTVFRPRFRVDNGNVYISDFIEETTQASIFNNTGSGTRSILDLFAVTNAAAIAGLVPPDGNVLIYGVPLVIGARKGLPNFNEFSMESTFVLTRKVELRKNNSGVVTATNQFFTMALTMPSAAEFWNSYGSNYNRLVDIYVTNRTTMTLTNDSGVIFNKIFITGEQIVGPRATLPYWPSAATRTYPNYNNPASFVIAMRTNVPFLPLIGYLPDRVNNAGFVSATNTLLFDTSQTLLSPRWGMTITNRVHAMVVDRATDRIIDYVLLGNLTSYRDLTAEYSDPSSGGGDPFDQLWATNAFGVRLTGRLGVARQIQISRGANGGVDLSSGRWRSFGNFTPSSAENEAVKFNRFLSVANTTNLVANVPYSPSVVYSVPMVWQANDPLVHYQSGELFHIAESGQVRRTEPPTLAISTNGLENIGRLNTRYKPWGKDKSALSTDPDAFNVSIKDPLVRSSDDWQFTTNALPTLGWLGRIHRGTPWQTIYLKSSNVGLTNIVDSPSAWAKDVAYSKAALKWAQWTGNSSLEGGYYTRPVTDRVLFDVFTTALNDNAARGRLSINQTGLAAWSAVLSGVVTLTNTSTEGALLAGATAQFAPLVIQPAGIYNAFNTNTWSPMVRIHDAINRTRNNKSFFANGSFNHLGDILAVPELTDASPFLNQSGIYVPIRGLNDAAYEWLPQQIMSLLDLGKPRFAIYAYGQSLQPAPNSIVTAGGAFFGLCTNYAITAEVATRTVVEIEGGAEAPRVVVKSYNILGPD